MGSQLRTALLFRRGNLAGAEYHATLVAAGQPPALVVTIGDFSAKSRLREQQRTAGRWRPPPVPPQAVDCHFDRPDDPGLPQLVRDRQIDICIQGGTGLLGDGLLSSARLGFLNVHPGALPEYRGNSCPEWALLEGNPVVATAHMMTAEIDAGPTILACPLDIPPAWDYYDIRAAIYPHCARVLLRALARLAGATPGTLGDFVTPQDESRARWRTAMPGDMLAELVRRRDTGSGHHGQAPEAAPGVPSRAGMP